MIQPGASSYTYYHLVEIKTFGQRKKVTSDKFQEADAILQDDTLSLEGKTLKVDQLATEVEADV